MEEAKVLKEQSINSINSFSSLPSSSVNNSIQKNSTEMSTSLIVKKILPKISIVTPSFNQGEFLEECIQSILEQGYPNLEYIIMDGGSKDNSIEIIKKYEKYLSYWQSQPDGGQYIAINDAFKNTTGEIMAWLNSDDKYHQNAFFKVASAFTNHQEIQWLTGRATAWDRDGKFTYFEASIPEWSREYLLKLTQEIRERRRFIQQESTFWKRSLWDQSGSNLNLHLELAGDFELWVRFSRYASLFPIDDFLGGFRSYEGQRSKLYIDKYMQEVELVVNQELLLENGEYASSTPAPEPIIIALPLGEIFANKNSHEQQDNNGGITTVTILEKREQGKQSNQKDDVVILTSIAPKNQEKQRFAIDSWQALGFSVVSLNIQSEIDQLQPLYQNVLFHAVTRDAHSEAGRPLVYLDDMLLYLRQHGTRIGGIVNSDICLKADSNFRFFIAQESVNSLVFGNRINLASLDDVYLQSLDWIDNTVGKYEYGFDYFFFDTSIIDLYPTEAFCIGMPWWDYWMPAGLLPTNVNLKFLDSRIAYHVVHPTNFSDLAWRKYGMKIGKYFLSYNSYAEMVEEIQSPNYEHDNWYTFHPLVELGEYILEKIYRSKRTKIIKYSPQEYATKAVSVELDNSIQQPIHHYQVSAIVSTYNSEKFIKDCLQDLIDQTLYKKGLLEIIVIDSASEQNEQEIVREFQKTYPNIVYDRTSERESLYASWNKAIKMSRGAYLTSANTDDTHRPDALEVMANYLDRHSQTSLVYADQLITTTANDTWATTKANQHWNWPSFDYSELERRCILGPQPMWRKSLHEKYGYFRSELTSAGDYEFWLRIGKTENIVRLPEILGLYYDNKQGLEHASPTSQQETHRILEEYGIIQRGVTTKISMPASVSPSELQALPYRTTTQPLVSVIIPTKDRPEMLAQAVQSVLNQTFPDIEIIVINDGGIDVQNVLDALNLKRNIIYLKHDQNLDRSAARNTGIHVASGKYIAYLDDDDTYHPSHVETLVNFLENSEHKVAYTDAVMAEQRKQDGKYVTTNRTVPYSLDFDNEKILVNNFIPILCLIHEKSCLDETGAFDVNLGTHEDWDLLIRLSRKFKIAHIKETTCEFVWRNDGSTTTSKNRVDFFRTRELIYQKYSQYAQGNSAIIEAQNLALQSDRQEALVLPHQSQPEKQLIQSQLELTQYQLKQAQAELEQLKAQLKPSPVLSEK
ncbi:glycosyltransferase [Microcoleus sp. PH2017_05_CCC_O_A]|uniref:glycosyltransferase n=1 Tax=Microcoleus sp. PH2017_05_CCC_O_A TaxID=2798816 RepID=UPI001DA8226A|nr:glycosyltransferase [Microcoleus sp. PH2017_05_CCC_O_A]MCC3437710.1 glycosyltransferase [Microcoleus sp. PH2017_05_CCC_O_A]